MKKKQIQNQYNERNNEYQIMKKDCGLETLTLSCVFIRLKPNNRCVTAGEMECH
jgi:hypothetical protein